MNVPLWLLGDTFLAFVCILFHMFWDDAPV